MGQAYAKPAVATWAPPTMRKVSTSSTSPLTQVQSINEKDDEFDGRKSSSSSAAFSPNHRRRRHAPVDEEVDPDAITKVTHPATPTLLTRLSSLIDPQDLDPNEIIRSPSGRFYRVREYLNNPDRPLSIRERQQHIRDAMAKRDAAEAEAMLAASRSPSVGLSPKLRSTLSSWSVKGSGANTPETAMSGSPKLVSKASSWSVKTPRVGLSETPTEDRLRVKSKSSTWSIKRSGIGAFEDRPTLRSKLSNWSIKKAATSTSKTTEATVSDVYEEYNPYPDPLAQYDNQPWLKPYVDAVRRQQREEREAWEAKMAKKQKWSWLCCS